MLSWDSCPPELSPPRSGIRSLASTYAGSRSPLPRTPPGAQPSRLHAATRTPMPGFANPGPVDTQKSIETRVSPSGGDPAHRASLERSRAPATSAVRALAGGEDDASCPCPLSAALRASLPFTTSSPRGGTGRWTSKTLSLRIVHHVPPLTRRGGDHTPHGAWPVARCRVDRFPTDSRQTGPRF